MLREDNKPVRVRVCGDLARFIDDEDLEVLQSGPEVSPAGACEAPNIRQLALPCYDRDSEAA